MKKTLCALAVLGAFAGTSLAADVTLWGIVDEGLLYTSIDKDDGQSSTDKLELKSGIQSGSRWGLRGAEELGNGTKVGFALESGFNADDGTLASAGTLFNREASLYVEGRLGKLAAGRIGAINQGTSSWAKLGTLSAFGTAFGDYVMGAGSSFAKADMFNNMIAYQTPKFGGFQVIAQYGMGEGGTYTTENTSKATRYYAVGATYNAGPAALYFAVDSTNYQTWDGEKKKLVEKADKIDDSLTVTFGGNYDFGVAKVFGGIQYFDEVQLKYVGSMKTITAADADTEKLKGYVVGLSASAPVLGGTALVGLSYIDAETADSYKAINPGKSYDATRTAVSIGYTYNLSKRTNIYSAASYIRDSYDFSYQEDKDPTAIAVAVGLRHQF
ncbi:MAG: porin [Sutterella sp.]|nr:porin [Sutterella sp.]